MPDIFVSTKTLENFMNQALVKSGVPEDDALIVTDVLMRSDLRGIESHGIGRFKMYLDRIRDKVQTAVTNFEIVKETPGTAVIDGHHGMGQVVAYRAMKMAVEKAKKNGIAAVAVRNGTHFGIAGYYPLMAIKENMVGITVTNARPSVAPTFGNEPFLGTNPIAFGAPTDEECPFMLDMGTPIIQRGKVEVYDRIEKKMPEGWVVDSNGDPLIDPAEVLKMLTGCAAFLLPLGGIGEETSGYKGYGLATMVEIMSAAFSGGPTGQEIKDSDKNGNKIPHRLGHFFIAIDISHFIEIDRFKKITGDLMRKLRNSGKLPGCDRIYTAGEKEFEKENEIPKTGIPINENLQEAMKKIKNDLNIDVPLPF